MKPITRGPNHWTTSVAALSIIVGLNAIPALLRQDRTPDYKILETADLRISEDAGLLSRDDVDLIATLFMHGVKTAFAEDCGDPETAGFYLGDREVLVLCVNGEHGPGGISDTLRHEAIHAAQDCKDGQDNTTFETLTGMTSLPDDELGAFLREHYEEAHHLIEYEAWAGAAQLTNDQIATVVSRVCPAI